MAGVHVDVVVRSGVSVAVTVVGVVRSGVIVGVSFTSTALVVSVCMGSG